MKINQKQYNYLNVLLKNYDLKKDINLITPFEASIVIEGIVNNGKVKHTYKEKILSDDDYKKKQRFFESLVSPKSKLATEKQLKYIEGLCKSSKYELVDKDILRQDANELIRFLKEGGESEVALKYLAVPKPKTYDDLIKIKKIETEEKSSLPEEWVLYNIEINGIIDF